MLRPMAPALPAEYHRMYIRPRVGNTKRAACVCRLGPYVQRPSSWSRKRQKVVTLHWLGTGSSREKKGSISPRSKIQPMGLRWFPSPGVNL